ncbi:hypothetical protein GPS47_14755 [Acinetobacter haemolyticus]|uniref:hypothetical protein n=1 Tax=Acinetobacter haemolyticus TaxID=29430 RepID=UPI001331D9C7|nr:hypothetical protein [Acinetobacter haemolyticus]NAR87833.1 hypothetical protein [Acinetobacter haemolyticus]NAS03026.1 hypothetical protein [Acinetobacter haemolyticus]NAS06809.1 hypothetical protein [Acinetobacter haemolyticus]NAS09201.1 hypothetical protein [Acinetobacter haemolyticus]QHI17042.1 hypothetical protein AhaeAN4_10810 [Acinetobacter haemolyticus]
MKINKFQEYFIECSLTAPLRSTESADLYHMPSLLPPQITSITTPSMLSLPQHLTIIERILPKKSNRVLKVSRQYGDAPHLHHTSFGRDLCQLIMANQNHPILNGSYPYVYVHPLSRKFLDLAKEYQVVKTSPFSPQFEVVMDGLCSHLKVYCKSRHYLSQLKLWESSYSKTRIKYNNAMTQTLNESDMFELQSLVLKIDINQPILSEYSKDYLLFDHNLSEIIKIVKSTQEQNNVIAVFSKWEAVKATRIHLRLIFVVKKEFSDPRPLEKSELYVSLQHLIDPTGIIQTTWSNLPEFLGGPEYHCNEFNFGKRLEILESYLVGTDLYCRIVDEKPSFEVQFLKNSK